MIDLVNRAVLTGRDENEKQALINDILLTGKPIYDNWEKDVEVTLENFVRDYCPEPVDYNTARRELVQLPDYNPNK